MTMQLPKSIRNNLRFLSVEVDSQVANLQSYFVTPSAGMARRILDRSGYAYNLKMRIHSSCLNRLACCEEGGAETMTLRGVEFIATKRPNIYSSAMKTNVFGGRQALDPLKGDPYVWARIDGQTLTQYVMIITDEGGYEMQTYERTLIASGMSLRFSRVRVGKVLKEVNGTLERVAP